jgi:uncharacterized protein (TIGR02246 family)
MTNRFPRRLVGPAILAALSFVVSPAGAQVADSAAAAAAIAESASAFSRALERGDAAGMASQYVDDATLIPPSGRLVTGRDAILAFWTPRNPDFRTLEHSLTTDRLVITGDVAVEVGTWRQRGQLREEAPTESSGRYLVVWRGRADGTWRMQFDSWTAPFPED